jgi:hypothetical protein
MQGHRYFRNIPFLVVTCLALLAALVGAYSVSAHNAAHAAPAAPGNGTTYGNLQVIGDTTIVSGSTTNAQGSQVQPETDSSPQVAVTASGSQTPGLPPPPTTNPNPTGRSVTSSNKDFFGFNGISHADQRTAGTGAYTNTQFSLEPPDQGLCAGNNFVVEAVNNGVAVYNNQGKILAGVEALSQFFAIAPEITRPGGLFGPFISDPKCLYDAGTKHWFLTELLLSTDPATGALIAPTYTYVAVSKTSNPTGSWTVLNFNTTDDGSNGTPTHTGCPCLGDQPLIGADHYGFYVSTNEFSLANSAFNGAQLYAISKKKLIAAATHTAGGPVTFAHINAADYLAPYGGISYSIQPSTTPPGGDSQDNATQSRLHGIEYFLSALQFGAPPYQVLDNRIATWALTNTQALDSSSLTPDIALHVTVIGTETYGQPNPAAQKPGPTPLRDALAASSPPVINPLEHLNTNDPRMNQVVFAQNSLWGAVNTLIGDGTRTGIAYFKIRPNWDTKGNFSAHLQNQGYIAVTGDSVIFPSIGVNADGQGVVVFTLVGPDYFPSSAYIRIGPGGVSGSIHIAGAGASPEDGFTGYAPYAAPGVARWGDYSAAVAVSDGSIWTASEYIPATPARTLLANWGTFVSHIVPN